MVRMAMNLRLTPEVDEKLAAIAAAEGASKQQVISNLIERRFELETGRAFAERELTEFFEARQDLMERLRDA